MHNDEYLILIQHELASSIKYLASCLFLAFESDTD